MWFRENGRYSEAEDNSFAHWASCFAICLAAASMISFFLLYGYLTMMSKARIYYIIYLVALCLTYFFRGVYYHSCADGASCG